jgi:gas vesicle protein
MNNDAGKTILALFAGLAAGVAIGVLLAPEKGEETRTKIADVTNKFSNNVREKITEGINMIRERKDEFAKAASDIADEVLS